MNLMGMFLSFFVIDKFLLNFVYVVFIILIWKFDLSWFWIVFVYRIFVCVIMINIGFRS